MMLDIHQLRARVANGEVFNFTFFYNGPYSQWALKPIVVDGIRYNCNEQYMMAQKAKLFKDEQSFEAIMKEKKPWKQKQLGRDVKRFNQGIWTGCRLQIVKKATVAKFTQHKDLNEMMIRDHKKSNNVFVEATNDDDIWAIGLDADHKDASDPRKWKGLNLLGFVLTDVAKMLAK